MASVLLIAENPGSGQAQTKAQWISLLRRAGVIAEQNKNVQILGDGIWQISLDGGAMPFVAIASEIQDSEFQYQSLFFEDAPKWVYSQAKNL